MKVYILSGNPTPLARARHGNNNVVYDPQKNIKFVHMLELKRQHGSEPLYDTNLELIISFFMPIPDSYSKKKKQALVGQSHFKKPDLSNLIKYIEDVCNGIVFTDDSIISAIVASKCYSDNPRTELAIYCKGTTDEQ